MAIVIVALIVAANSLLIAALTNRARRDDKQQDWDRQDRREREERERQENTAKLLLDSQHAIAEKADYVAEQLLDANERVAKDTQIVSGKLDAIHTLVNSNMTAALQSEHDAMAAHRVVLLEVIADKRSRGIEPSPDAITTVAMIDTKLAELQAVLSDRRLQTKLADAALEESEMIVRGRPVDGSE